MEQRCPSRSIPFGETEWEEKVNGDFAADDACLSVVMHNMALGMLWLGGNVSTPDSAVGALLHRRGYLVRIDMHYVWVDESRKSHHLAYHFGNVQLTWVVIEFVRRKDL